MITVEHAKDFADVKAIVMHEAIWDRVREGLDDLPPVEALYLLAKVDDKPAGMFIILPNGDSHIHILPSQRAHKYEIGKAVLHKAQEYFDRLTAKIDKKFPEVHQFALKNGYTVTRETDTHRHYEVTLWP